MTDPITTTDAPRLVSMLAEMRLHMECLAALRVWGATPKAQTMAQEAVDRTTNAVVDLVRGLRERAKCADRELDEAEYERDGLRIELAFLRTPRPRDEWRESDGTVLWWRLPVVEPPYVGDPREDDFPKYLTHWTPIPVLVAADQKDGE